MHNCSSKGYSTCNYLWCGLLLWWQNCRRQDDVLGRVAAAIGCKLRARASNVHVGGIPGQDKCQNTLQDKIKSQSVLEYLLCGSPSLQGGLSRQVHRLSCG